MAKKYLFSPVGNTDPIKYFRDGSLLHICRHYKPDIVYLYLSREMLENHQRDNRYRRTLELLGKELQHEFDIRIISNERMCEVQEYDVFFKEFQENIAQIEKEKDSEDLLLVNMASGTPAMKSALLIMATLAEYRFLPIQVSTPQKRSNLEHEERQEYDVDTNWELNEDNQPDQENRCKEVRCMNLVRLLKIDIIKKHLNAFDYQAAFSVAKDIREDISDKACRWIEAAAARAMLDWEKMNSLLLKGENVIPKVKAKDINRELFEYTLVLDLKVRRGEYADFLRAITPLSVDLLELVLQKFCNINIEDYSFQSKSCRVWSKEKLQNAELLELLLDVYQPFKYGPIYSSHLNVIVQKKCSDSGLAQRIQQLVEVERKVRNIAAHQIVSVTPAWIKEHTGKTVEEIMHTIKNICETVGINKEKERWEAYSVMNSQLMEELENFK